jgi:hypothetical protein
LAKEKQDRRIKILSVIFIQKNSAKMALKQSENNIIWMKRTAKIQILVLCFHLVNFPSIHIYVPGFSSRFRDQFNLKFALLTKKKRQSNILKKGVRGESHSVLSTHRPNQLVLCVFVFFKGLLNGFYKK